MIILITNEIAQLNPTTLLFLINNEVIIVTNSGRKNPKNNIIEGLIIALE